MNQLTQMFQIYSIFKQMQMYKIYICLPKFTRTSVPEKKYKTHIFITRNN